MKPVQFFQMSPNSDGMIRHLENNFGYNLFMKI